MPLERFELSGIGCDRLLMLGCFSIDKLLLLEHCLNRLARCDRPEDSMGALGYYTGQFSPSIDFKTHEAIAFGALSQKTDIIFDGNN